MTKLYNFLVSILKISTVILLLSYALAVYLSITMGNLGYDINTLVRTLTTLLASGVLIYLIFNFKKFKQVTNIETVGLLTVIIFSSGVLAVI